MPSVLVYLHLVWSTKYRESFLNSRDLRTKVWKHIKANAIEKQIYIDTVNGYDDHCHCLVSLRVNQTIQEVVQLIKGESSFWINRNGLTEKKFQWQNDYYAASVSGSHVNRVRAYIRNQEKHHQKINYPEERDLLIRKLGFQQHFDG